jgi:small-conductance mechanosensitive channel
MYLRTPKNEDLTIPNTNILGGNIVNYTKSKKDRSILFIQR